MEIYLFLVLLTSGIIPALAHGAVREMKIYVTVELFRGVIEEVRAFRSYEVAEGIQTKWMRAHGVSSDDGIDYFATDSNEFRIFECDVEG